MSNRWKKNEGASSPKGRWEAARDNNKEKEDKAFDLYADMIIKKIETVKEDWKKPWFTEGQLGWPKSFYGKKYHGSNALMLALLCEMKGYKMPVFVTSKRLDDLNYSKDEKGLRHALQDDNGEKLPFVHILKGEKSFPVFLTKWNIVNKETRERIPLNDFIELPQEEKEKYDAYHYSKVYNVFNIDQSNLSEARPELYNKFLEENVPTEKEYDGEVFSFEPLDLLVENNLWLCPIHPLNQDKAYYSPGKDEIIIPTKRQFQRLGNTEAYYGTMLHEMTHSTGHENRLNRLSGGHGTDEYAKEELVAELGAAMCCHRYGMDKVIKNDSLPYLKNWLDQLHEKPEFIRNVLKDVKAATNVIFTHIEAVRENRLDKIAKLDGREEDAGLDMDEDGNVLSEGSDAILADKKQGEEEGRTKGEEDDNNQKPHILHSRYGF